MNKNQDTMLSRAEALAPELVRLRREIHRYPELGFQEFRTAALVADTLREIGGLTIRTGVGVTGVVAEIGESDGPTIAIRADMDALPIQEQNDTAYSSQNPGVMHACGHDGHTAILLGVAHLLRQSQMTDAWKGKVRLIFQPSEEAFNEDSISGATAMIQDGAMEDVDAAIALHLWSTHPSRHVYFQDGFSLAAVDTIDAWVRGDGGHGAYPHTGSDPLAMLGPILTALYAIPSRRINPLLPSVVSLGQIKGGEIHNVIPNEVQLRGTIRSFDPLVRSQLWIEVERALKISELLGGSYELKITEGYPAMYNEPRVNGWLRDAAADQLVGDGALIDTEFGMGAEDFAYMTAQVPGAMFMLGAAIADDVTRSHHTAIFDFDEKTLPLGAAILAETARRFVTGTLDFS